MPSALGPFALALAAALGRPDAPRPETSAQQLHRKAVHCMDELERTDCATRNFERLLDEHTNERDLIADALNRLIHLYQKEGDSQALKAVMRRFWEAGKTRASTGHVPFSVRFFPEWVSILASGDVSQVANSRFLARVDPDLKDYIFSCDEARREKIAERYRWRRARHRAKSSSRTAEEIYDEDKRKEQARRKKHGKGYAQGEPIASVAACPVARALGDDHLQGWTRAAIGLDATDFHRSIMVAEIPDLDRRLALAQQRGRLHSVDIERWSLPKLEYDKERVHLARLDRNELVIAPDSVIGAVIAARAKGRRTLNADVQELIDGVPRSTEGFFVLTEDALAEFGAATMSRGTRFLVRTLLPRPKGVQVAMLWSNDLGIFSRLPTDNEIKAQTLVAFANRVLEGKARRDREAEAWLERLDFAESSKGKALLVAYVMVPEQARKMMFR